MSAIEKTPSLQTLTNLGVPILVHKVSPAADGLKWNREYQGEGDDRVPVRETQYVRFTALALAEIETRYGGREGVLLDSDQDPVLDKDGNKVMTKLSATEGWEQELETNPNSAIIDTLAIVWEVPRAQAGKMIIDQHVDDYSTAIGAAFLMAQGIEGDAVVRVIKTGVKSSVELRESLSEAGLRAVEAAEVEAEERNKKIKDALAADESDAPDTQTNPSPSNPGKPDSTDGSNSAAALTSSGV